MPKMDRTYARTAARAMMRGKGLSALEANRVLAALEQASEEGLRGAKARKRALAILNEKYAGVDWAKILEILGPIILMILQLFIT